MKIQESNSRRNLEYATITALVVAALWPLTRINPIADDLHLVAQGSGLMRQQGLSAVIQQWADWSLQGAHVTPVGGLLTALHVWVVNQLSLRTSLTIDDAWGLLRVAWIALALLSTVWFAKRMLRYLGLWSPGRAVTALILLGTLQVHGYWSNDPVTAFPVASWAFCVIGVLYLGLVLESLRAPANRRRLWVGGAILAAFIGVLTYELFIAFIAASVVLLVVPLFRGEGSWRTVLPLATFGGLVPGGLLILMQIFRLSQGSSYGGTEIAADRDGLLRITLVALMSSLPLAAVQLTLSFFPSDFPNLSTVLPSASGLIFLALLGMLQRRQRHASERDDVRSIAAVVLALLTLWIVSTLVIVATPKYQSELAGILGRVYINYAPSWIAISLLTLIAIARLVQRFGSKGLRVSLILLLLVGFVHSWTSGTQIDVLARDSSWSSRLLKNLESPISEGLSRCREIDLLFSLPFPEYYQIEILDGMEMSYSGTHGLSYCDFTPTRGETRPLVRPVAGTYPVEHLGNNRRIMWTSASEVEVQVFNFSGKPVNGDLMLTLSLPACIDVRTVRLSDSTVASDQSPREFVLSTTSPTAQTTIPVTLENRASMTVGFTQSGEGCSLGTDPRSLWTMMEVSSIRSF